MQHQWWQKRCENLTSVVAAAASSEGDEYDDRITEGWQGAWIDKGIVS